MRKLSALLVLAALCDSLAGAGPDWQNYGGDPQRSGWQTRDKYFNTGNIKDLKLLWKRQLDNRSKGLNSLTAPVIIGPIFTHRGIKELVFVGGSPDNFYAVDVDLGRLFWKRHLEGAIPENVKWPCGGGLTSAPVIDPVVLPAKHIAGNQEEDDPRPMRPVYVLASNGTIHKLRSSTGEDIGAPVQFIPPNAKASSLNFADNVLYTTTADECGGAANGVWAISANTPDARAAFFALPATGGVSVGADGTIYSGRSIVALSPGTLKLKDSFAPGGKNAEMTSGSPVPFSWKGRELVAAASEAGLAIFDAGRLARGPVAKYDGAGSAIGFNGDLATWEDPTGTRWIYSVVRGAAPLSANFPLRNGNAPHGSIMAFRIEERDGQPTLRPAWISRDLLAPVAPVIANGVVFALASGEYTGQTASVQEVVAKSTHATLYALNAATGNELYSSGNTVESFTHSSGLAVSRGHVCFGTWDNTLYCFGFPIEMQQP